jgi:hypothetical protein
LFWILKFFFDKKERKEIITGFISCLICGIILLGYCGLMKAQHGEFSVTAVSYINNTVTAIKSGSYKNASNQEMIKLVDEIKGDKEEEKLYWDAYNALNENYTIEDLKEFASSSIKNNPDYIKYLIYKTEDLGFINIGTASYVTNLTEYSKINYNYIGNLILPINFAFVYIIMLIAIIYLIWNLIKNKEIDWIVSFFTVLIVANLFTLIVGAPSESQRLFVASIIPILLLIGKVISNYKKL